MLELAEITQGEDGRLSAGLPLLGVTVDSGGQLFKRRAMKPWAPGGKQDACLLVAELDGVRCYVAERDGRLHLVVTKADLYPEFEHVQTAAA